MGIFKDKEEKKHNGPKHKKPNDAVLPLPLSKEEQLKRDIELIDTAYAKGEKTTHPAIQANDNLKGKGRHKKPGK